jgi:hypothetical protein
MTLQEFLKTWIADQAPSKRDQFIDDVRGLVDPPERQISIESVLTSRDLEPRVDVRIGPYSFQADPEEARKIARDLLEVAGGAETDAFVYHELVANLKLAPQPVLRFIAEMRNWRNERRERYWTNPANPPPGRPS